MPFLVRLPWSILLYEGLREVADLAKRFATQSFSNKCKRRRIPAAFAFLETILLFFFPKGTDDSG